MGTIIDFQLKIKSLIKKMPILINESIKDNEATVIDTIIEEQLMKGIRGDGQKIGEYKNKEYKKLKKQMNPKAGGFVDTRFEGDFHAAFKIQPDGEFLKVNSTDQKAPKLEKKYGAEIYILTDKNHTKIVKEYILPDLQKKIKDELQLS